MVIVARIHPLSSQQKYPIIHSLISSSLEITMASHNPVASLPLPSYFSHLAKSYNRSTANTTLDVFADILASQVQTSDNPIDGNSVVHDNAAGPGVATAGIYATLAPSSIPKEILISDNNDGMVSGARDSFNSPNISYKNLDAHDLSSLADNYFTHSITNFSIFTFAKAETAMSEVYRTLRPGGTAVVTSWRRFAVLPIVHEVQKRLRPDLPLMPVPGPRFFEEGQLETVLTTAGFERENIRSLERDILVKEEDAIAGLKEFMSGGFMDRAREGYTKDDIAKWGEILEKVVEDEIAAYGGISFQCFIAIATK